jgi:CBS domain-containing protein
MKTEAAIGTVRVRDAMHHGVFSCDRAAPLSEVAALMARERVHCVVVEGDGDGAASTWGIVSDLDLVAAATVRDLRDQSAGGSAATPVVMVAPSETLERAAQLMTEHGIAHVLVAEADRPLGVLSTIDIARVLAEEP